MTISPLFVLSLLAIPLTEVIAWSARARWYYGLAVLGIRDVRIGKRFDGKLAGGVEARLPVRVVNRDLALTIDGDGSGRLAVHSGYPSFCATAVAARVSIIEREGVAYLRLSYCPVPLLTPVAFAIAAGTGIAISAGRVSEAVMVGLVLPLVVTAFLRLFAFPRAQWAAETLVKEMGAEEIHRAELMKTVNDSVERAMKAGLRPIPLVGRASGAIESAAGQHDASLRALAHRIDRNDEPVAIWMKRLESLALAEGDYRTVPVDFALVVKLANQPDMPDDARTAARIILNIRRTRMGA